MPKNLTKMCLYVIHLAVSLGVYNFFESDLYN